MPVTVPAWIMNGGVRRDIPLDDQPTCTVPGTYHTPVRWVLTARHNPSGLPGCGNLVIVFACALHLHKASVRVAKDAVSGVTLTPCGH